MNLTAPDQAAPPALAAGNVRRLLLALISQAQADLQRRGLIQQDQALASRSWDGDSDALDTIAIDEATLGFDSLSRLDLINAVNQFFQLSRSGAEDYLLLTPTVGRWLEVVLQHLTIVGADQHFGFATSGSMGPVSVHVHSLSDLEAEVAALCEGPLCDLAGVKRILALVPPHHIYGFLFTCLLPKNLGVEVVDLSRKAPSALARVARPGDLVIGTPFSWDMVAKAGLPLVSGVCGITSAGPSTADTWDLAAPGRPDAMIEIYGATETGGLGSRQSWNAPFDLLPHLVPLKDGIARSGAPMVPLAVQDHVIWQEPRRFSVQGRRDQVVQVAGVNVQPGVVREHILALDEVADVAVRMGRDRLKAFVVPQPDVTDLPALQRTINTHLRKRFPASACPGDLRFGSSLPRNTMGKLKDWDVGEPVSLPVIETQEKQIPANLVN